MTRKAASRKTAARKAAPRKAAARKAAPRKAAASKTATREVARTSEPHGEIAVTATGVTPSIEERMAAPLSEIERMVDSIRDRADALREISGFDPFNPLTFNPMTWEMPSWKDLRNLFDVRVPTIDVVNQEKDILVVAEVPGVEKDDIVVTVTDRTATIKGARHNETQSDEDEVHRHEIRTGSFSRTITLPEEVDGRKAKASYKAGVITLRLPKRRISKKHNVTLD